MPRHPSQGPGHGGPATGAGKGPGSGGPAKPFTAASETRVTDAAEGNHDPVEQGYRSQRRMDRRARREYEEEVARKAFDRTVKLIDSPTEGIALAAAEKIQNRVWGMPMQRNLNVNSDDIASLSDDELRSELERVGGAGPADSAGGAAPGVQAQPSDVVH